MTHRSKHIIFPVFFLIFLFSSQIEGTAQIKPWTLRGCMRYLDKHSNDTLKYDFKVSPFKYCYFKYGFGAGFRNGMGLWRVNPLTIHFRVRGIWHADDMSAIIKRSFYRYLNDKPLKFREQKKKYKAYWEETEKGRDYLEIHDELWGQYETPDSILKEQYLKLFYPDRKVLGDFIVIKKTSESSYRNESINYIAKVIAVRDNKLELSIINVGQIPDGYEMADSNFETEPNVGVEVIVDPCMVYLIPDE